MLYPTFFFPPHFLWVHFHHASGHKDRSRLTVTSYFAFKMQFLITPRQSPASTAAQRMMFRGGREFIQSGWEETAFHPKCAGNLFPWYLCAFFLQSLYHFRINETPRPHRPASSAEHLQPAKLPTTLPLTFLFFLRHFSQKMQTQS